MATTDEYRVKVQAFERNELIALWHEIDNNNTPRWDNGKALEFLVLRAFELEGASIRWPFEVIILNQKTEQIDGVIHFNDINLSVLVECKDHSKNIKIEPISKLRNQLLRRPSGAIGAIFSTTDFSEPTLILSQFLAPQTILLWDKKNIEYCITNGCFRDGLLKKYRFAIEEGFPNFDLTENEF